MVQVVDVLHPGRPNVPHSEIQKELAEKYRAKPNCVFTFGMKCSFGGGKSTGFGLIYDNEAKAMASEPQWRLVRVRAASAPAAPPGSAAPALPLPLPPLSNRRCPHAHATHTHAARRVQNGMTERTGGGAKSKKERKNRMKKLRGTAKAEGKKAA